MKECEKNGMERKTEKRKKIPKKFGGVRSNRE